MRPARKRLALAATATAAATMAVAATFAAPAAHAASTTKLVVNHIWLGGCEAILYTNTNVPAEASAGFYLSTVPGTTIGCTGWLERRYGTGSFSVISGYHHLDLSLPGESAGTAWYDDGGNAQARACVTTLYGDRLPQTACTAAW